MLFELAEVTRKLKFDSQTKSGRPSLNLLARRAVLLHLRELLLDQIEFGPWRKIRKAIRKMLNGSRNLAFLGKDDGQKLLGVQFDVQRIHGQRFIGQRFGDIEFLQLEIGVGVVIPEFEVPAGIAGQRAVRNVQIFLPLA